MRRLDVKGVTQCTLSCIIVNYRTPRLVLDCLPGLLAELEPLDAQVVIVDNKSGDDSTALIPAWVEEHGANGRVHFVESAANGGFAAGTNIGIKTLPARYYLLLNSDTLICGGSIRALVATADQHPAAGLVSPRLECRDGTGQESCFRFPSPVSEFTGAAQTAVIDRVFQRFLVPLPVQKEMVRPQWTSFACALVRGEVFEQVGLLDEGYFMYFEDVEFCHRARKAGWEILHNPVARVVHLRGGSSSMNERIRTKKRVPRYYYESRTRYFYQVYGPAGLAAANLFWWLGRAVSKTRQVFGRPDKAAVEGAWRDICTNWSNPLRPYTHPDSRAYP